MGAIFNIQLDPKALGKYKFPIALDQIYLVQPCPLSIPNTTPRISQVNYGPDATVNHVNVEGCPQAILNHYHMKSLEPLTCPCLKNFQGMPTDCPYILENTVSDTNI